MSKYRLNIISCLATIMYEATIHVYGVNVGLVFSIAMKRPSVSLKHPTYTLKNKESNHWLNLAMYERIRA